MQLFKGLISQSCLQDSACEEGDPNHQGDQCQDDQGIFHEQALGQIPDDGVEAGIEDPVVVGKNQFMESDEGLVKVGQNGYGQYGGDQQHQTGAKFDKADVPLFIQEITQDKDQQPGYHHPKIGQTEQILDLCKVDLPLL